MADPLRVGIVGTGAIAQIAHLPILRKIRGAEVTALCDNDVTKARALAGRFDIPDAYDDIEEMLRHGEVDAVAICTPNHLHESHAVAALSAGKHVLCERPLALSVEAGKRVLASAQRHKRVVTVGMNHRFRRDVQALREFMRGGELGAVHSVRTGWYAHRPSRQMLGWRLKRERSGGGALLDLGLPIIDLGLWLVGNPKPVSVRAILEAAPDDRVEAAGCALIECEGGVGVFVDVTWRFMGPGERFWVDVHAEHGAGSINPLKVYKSFHGTPTDVTPTGAQSHENIFSAAIRAEWEFFVTAARGEVESTSAREQVELLGVMHAAYRSAREGHDIAL